MLDRGVIKIFLVVFLAGMGMFAIGKSGLPSWCYENEIYSLLCLPIHMILGLGMGFFFPVAFAGYVFKFGSSSEYYAVAIPYWLIVSFLMAFAYYRIKK